jgi:3-hydroxyacyl-[acyl-carrier-protein] dehydratase
MDQQELRALARSAGRQPLWIPGPADAVSIGQEGIQRLLPHRAPFLFVDALTDVGLAERAIRARRRIDPKDPVFEGHFPGNPIYPGVLQLETVGQLGLCLMHFVVTGSVSISADTKPRDIRAVKVHYAQFFAPVGPGDDLTVICKAIAFDEYTATYAGQVLRGVTICSFGVSEVYFVDE